GKWGTTPWTRVEEDAIRDRCNAEGPDFTVFISLDKNKPRWLSRTQLWYDYTTFGLKGAAAIVSKKVAEYGGVLKEESVDELAARLQRDIQWTREFAAYYCSPQAVKDAWEEFETLRVQFSLRVEKLSAAALIESMGTYRTNRDMMMHSSYENAMWVKFKQEYADTLREAELTVAIENMVRFAKYRSPNDRIHTYKSSSYTFAIDKDGNRFWSAVKDKETLLSTDQLLDKWMKQWLEIVHLNRRKSQEDRLRI
ncbi:MAG: hypothetical protein IPO05_07335, partial [Flavobacteriales bacterium]|nr:hypothetical protein [Flavobacteriales bacterium]